VDEKERTKEAYEYIVHRRKPLEYLRLLGKKKTIVDVGCGSGQNCLAADANFKVCLDFSERQLSEAKKRGCENLVLADMEFMPFRDGSVDGLLYIASLHHLREPNNAVSEAVRILKEGGNVLVTVWLIQPKFLFRRNVVIRSSINGKRVERYYKLYYPWELKKLMEKFGFTTLFSKNYRVNSIFPNNSIYLGKKFSRS
jgi:ubiquinone/menaquinone biosynthesis C-methylase UbiE